MSSGPAWFPEERELFNAHYQRLRPAEMSELLAAHGYNRTPRACRDRAYNLTRRREKCCRRIVSNHPDPQARLGALGTLMLAGIREARGRGLEVAAREVVEAAFELARYQPDVLDQIIERQRRRSA